jgi:hypothetical protein
VALAVGPAIEDMGELESADGIDAGQTMGDGGTDGAKTENGDATGRWAATGGVKRIDTHRLSPSSPLRDAGIATGAEGRNWHLSRDESSRGCRGVTGPVPQPLWIKKSRIQLSGGLYQTVAGKCKSTYAHISIR